MACTSSKVARATSDNPAVEVYIREAALSFMPASLSSIKLKPYIAIGVNDLGHAHRHTPVAKRWTAGVVGYTFVDTVDCNAGADFLRFELWHRRMFRRDILIATAKMSLADLSSAHSSGMALDRWLPLHINQLYQSVTAQSNVMGMVHVIARNAIIPLCPTDDVRPGAGIAPLSLHSQSSVGVPPLASQVPAAMAGAGAAGSTQRPASMNAHQVLQYTPAGGSGMPPTGMGADYGSSMRTAPGSGVMPGGHEPAHSAGSSLATDTVPVYQVTNVLPTEQPIMKPATDMTGGQPQPMDVDSSSSNYSMPYTQPSALATA